MPSRGAEEKLVDVRVRMDDGPVASVRPAPPASKVSQFSGHISFRARGGGPEPASCRSPGTYRT